MPTADQAALEKGLPANTDAEKFILGSVLLDGGRFLEVAGSLTPDDFALEKHRRIFGRMLELHDRDEKIDRITLANELNRHNELQSVDGLSYLVSLDDGLPQIPNLDSYIGIVREKATLRKIALSARDLMNRAIAGTEDSTEILNGAEAALLRLGESKDEGGLLGPAEIVGAYKGGVNAFLNPSQRAPGLKTGFERLDWMTNGLHGGELFILAARPAMGKTSLAMNIAANVADKGNPVAVFSLEMPDSSLLWRVVCAEARIDQSKFRSGWLNADERSRLRQALDKVSEWPLRIDDNADSSLPAIERKLTTMKATHGLALVVIDYLQLMSGSRRAENRNQEVSGLSRGLKLMARKFDVPFLVLSQLSRESEKRQGNHRPQLSDLRESGAIEQDADVVAFIFREEVYKPDREDLNGRAELIIAKQRNGPIGKVALVFLENLTKFESAAYEAAEEEAA